MSTESFVPKMIGFQDIENKCKIDHMYTGLVSAASAFLWETQNLFKDDEITHASIIKMLNMNKEELILFLKREFIRVNNISYPGLNVEKLISQDLIDLPDNYDVIISAFDYLNGLYKEIETTKFNFPLNKLIEKDGFDLNEEFHAELLEFTATFTESEKQNQVLDVVQRFCDLMSEMKSLGIISSAKGAWQYVVQTMDMAIVEDVKKEPSLYPYRHMFKKTPVFNKFLTDTQIQKKSLAFKPAEVEE
ncbi:MAG: hypothetical protein WCJ95_06110 [Mariniphaga sp.]